MSNWLLMRGVDVEEVSAALVLIVFTDVRHELFSARDLFLSRLLALPEMKKVVVGHHESQRPAGGSAPNALHFTAHIHTFSRGLLDFYVEHSARALQTTYRPERKR